MDERGQFSFKEAHRTSTPPEMMAGTTFTPIEARDEASPVTVMVTEVNEGPVITRQGNAPGTLTLRRMSAGTMCTT